MILKIKKSQLNQVILIVLGISVLISLIGVTITTNNVIGANITNETVVTRAYVWNTEPNLYEVTITPGTIDLSPGSTKRVNCTGRFWDYNGWQDVANGTINATLYDNSLSNSSAADDKNYHYTNSSCGQCSEITGSNGANGTCTCFFSIEYFANSGNWSCNMTIRDYGRNITDPTRNMTFADSMVSNVTITKLLALDVPSEINYGNLSVTEVSSDVTENVTNNGNVAMNISVRGYATYYNGSDNVSDTSLAMVCELGNISISKERYSVASGITFSNMTQLSGADTLIVNLTVNQRTNDASRVMGQDTNKTFWKLEVPYTVGGACNGTVIFSAIDAS